MRFISSKSFTSVFLLFFAALTITGSNAEDVPNSRRKRFLAPETWALIPEGLLRLGDHARELTSRTLDGLMQEATKDSAILQRRKSPLEAIFGDGTKQKELGVRVKGNRELETEDEEPTDVVVEEPHREKDEVSIFNPLAIPLSFTFGLFTPWWKGPNVCIERNEVDEQEPEEKSLSFNINFEATQCIPTESTYVCTKKIRNNDVRKSIIIKYQCCHGYIRRTDGKPGCSEVKMDDLMQTLRSLDASKFADILESTSFAEKLLSENFTIFAPSNDAVMDFEEETENNEIFITAARKRNRDRSHFVGGHIVEGFVNLATAENDQVLNSLNGKTTIRINKYRPSQQVLTANCVPISAKDNFATNGLVHLASDVLPLPRKTITDIVTGSEQFSIFSKMLSESDFIDELRDPKKSWTIFAPTDDAFKALDKDILRRFMSGEGCVENVLRNHVLQGTICSHAVLGTVHIQNFLGKPLTLSRDDIEKFKVNGIQVNTSNVLGTNGVVHFIDEVMLPPEANTLLESLEKSGRSDLLQLINAADLDATFENLKNATFFVPSKDAIKSVPNDTLQEWRDNPEKLSEILKYHIAVPMTPSLDFRQNKELASLSDGLNIRIQLHELFPGIAVAATAQCSLVVKHDNEVCGAVLHTVDKVLLPPKDSIIETLKNMEGHEIIRKLLADTDLEKKLNNGSEGPYTLLAPNDEAFKRFEKQSLDDLFENKTRAEQILKMHVLPEVLCCRGVHHTFPFSHHYVRTLEGNLLTLHRNGRLDRIRFGPARAVSCDITARNGLIHSVNRVILPNRRPSTSLFDLDIFRLF